MASLTHLIAHSDTGTAGQHYNLLGTHLWVGNYMTLRWIKEPTYEQLWNHTQMDEVDHRHLLTTYFILGTALVLLSRLTNLRNIKYHFLDDVDTAGKLIGI